MNRFFPTAFAAFVAFHAAAAFAQATIDQNKALAGSVTPGDTPGFPVTLSVPGHYKLMSNLVVPASVGGIEITAPNVTLDLNGFTISSTNTCIQNANKYVTCTRMAGAWARSGVFEAPGVKGGTVVRNGAVQGFDGSGVAVAAPGALVDGVRASHNGVNGIDLQTASRIRDSVAMLNYQVGLLTADGVIERSISQSNSSGFSALGSLVSESHVTRNATAGAGGYLRGVVFGANASGLQGGISMGGNTNGGVSF